VADIVGAANQPTPSMNTLHDLQVKIVEGLNDLYEAFYAAQEKIEESDFEISRIQMASFGGRNNRLTNCERNAS
jgi:hypothetical protein